MNFRALCDACEAAEAQVWCKTESLAFCMPCSKRIHGASSSLLKRADDDGDADIGYNTLHGKCRHELARIVRGSVLSPFCGRCVSAPAVVHWRVHGVSLCEICVGDISNEGVDGGIEKSKNGMDEENKWECYMEQNTTMVGLRETHLGDSITFDKMDFSSTCLNPMTALCTEGAVKKLDQYQPTARVKVTKWLASSNAVVNSGPDVMRNAPVDLSYFQTTVPGSQCRNHPAC